MTTIAELIIRNATVRTPTEHAAAASALAIRDGRILALGGEELLTLHAGADTEIVDLAGAVVLPGLIDAHNHHATAGRAELFELQFPHTAGVHEILEAVAAWAAAHPDDEWIVGGAWGSGLFDALAAPEALAGLDAASLGKKVLLSDDSHHNKWVNSAALAAAGIGPDTPDPEGGRILHRGDGAPSGVLLEGAGGLVEQARAAGSAPSAEDWARSSKRAIEILNERGITAFQDASGSEGLIEGLALLDRRGELTAWSVTALLINDFIFGTRVLGTELFAKREASRTRHHRPDFAKLFLDGVPPAYTAAFLEPYRPSAAHGDHFHGGTTVPPEELLGWLRTAAAEGLTGVKVHATGDASVRFVLDAVEQLRADGGRGADLIVHVAHGQFVAERDIPRFAPLGVVAEISPGLWYPGIIVQALREVLPDAVGARIHPNRDLLDAGATLAVGSDWPVSPDPNPWPAIAGLVTRADPYGQSPGTVWPEQAITVREAIAAYTIGGATALGIGDETGSLEAGKSADFVVIDRDPFAIDPADIAGTRVLATWFEGRRVYAAESADSAEPAETATA